MTHLKTILALIMISTIGIGIAVLVGIVAGSAHFWDALKGNYQDAKLWWDERDDLI